ncbi:MAG: type I secretion system permease/ATPase [Burkholderiaceae bacterium]|nr:type I secretion system permease/ATPase [Burkholderiaceae bacterium]
MNPNKRPAAELREALATLRPYFVRASWLSLATSLLVLAPTGYMLEVYDRVVNSRSHMTLAMLTLLVLGAYMLMELLEWVRTAILHEAGIALDRKMSARVFNALFEANLRRVPGGMVQSMNDLRTVRDFLHASVLTALMEAPASIVFAILIFAISPVLGWSAVVGALVQVGIAWLTERSTQPPLSAANRTAIAAQQYADGSLRNAEVIESMGMLRDIHKRWMDKQREFLRLQAVASDAAGSYQAVAKFVQQVMGSLLLGLGAWLLLNRSLNGGAGMMIIGSVLGGRMLAPLVQIIAQWRTVVNARDAMGRLEQLLANVPPRPESMRLPPPRGALTVEALVAAAPGSAIPIVRGVQFALPAGRVLAVVGPSASGKTTLARLLVGIWPAASGKVRLDGADVFTWDKSELGPHMGYLPQGVELFEGTLAENIARFGEVDMAKVEAAARLVGMHEFILGLPQGYDSPVGRDGAMLSGGQRQRVALARALYGKPAFVVLDEPNSSLDEEGDAALAQAILTLKQQGTTFVVMTHRTSVLAVADAMLVLRDGTQQAFGPRDEVLAALQQAAQQAAQQTAAAAQPRPAAPGALPAAS